MAIKKLILIWIGVTMRWRQLMPSRAPRWSPWASPRVLATCASSVGAQLPGGARPAGSP
ncbi:MAG: hypothetical protein ACLU0O_02310 [Collinsella sp.]